MSNKIQAIRGMEDILPEASPLWEQLEDACREVFRQYGAAQAHDEAARHPGFHKTHSVDYAVVIEGEIWALMDVGETLMKVGDVLIQRGTNHAWANRTDHIARVLFVLNGAAPA